MTIKEISNHIRDIKESFDTNVIKNWNISSLMNCKTLEDVGYQVNIQFSTEFDYDEVTINHIKSALHADDWYLNVKNNQLYIHYIIRYENN